MLSHPADNLSKRLAAIAMAVAMATIALAPQSLAAKDKTKAPASEMTMEMFLDRLMAAESGGRANAKNPLSTALGPYQFIASTWLMIARKDFAKETEGLRVDQILALRTDPNLARRAAEIYIKESAAYLVSQGQKATFPNLRLAFLVGPGAALRVLMAGPDRTAEELLGATVIGANPFMSKMTATDLIARAARDIESDPATSDGVTPDPSQVLAAAKDAGPASAPKAKRSKPRIEVACDLSLPSCKKWLALAERRVNRGMRRASR